MRNDNDLLREAERWLDQKEQMPRSQVLACIFLVGMIVGSLYWVKLAGTRNGKEAQDCDWPLCGCDPYANKVIEALNLSGTEKPVRSEHSVSENGCHSESPADRRLRWKNARAFAYYARRGIGR